MRFAVFLVLFCTSLFAIPSFAQQRGFALTPKFAESLSLGGTHRALVIGNNEYRDPRRLWRPLKTAVNDAEAVARVLRQDYRFGQVRLLKDATRREMIAAFNDLAARSR